MNLAQMRLEVRRAIDELTASFWTDQEITDWLNEGAKIMCSDAQPIQATKQILTVQSQQEYDLGQDVDEIFGVTYLRSTLFQLKPIDQRQVQFGNPLTGLPQYYYIRQVSSQFAGQVSGGGQQVTNVNADPTVGTTVLGLWPISSANSEQITISYFARHFNMTNDKDVSPIPLEFHRGIVSYAIAMAKMKDEAYGEASQVFLPMFQQFKDRLKEKMMNRGQEAAFPKVQMRDEFLMPGGSSIIYIGKAT